MSSEKTEQQANAGYRVVTPGEIETGMHVTVLRPVASEQPGPASIFESIMPRATFQGDTLEVLAVETPYILVRNLSAVGMGGMFPGPFPLDTRTCVLMTLRDEWVDTVKRFLSDPEAFVGEAVKKKDGEENGQI